MRFLQFIFLLMTIGAHTASGQWDWVNAETPQPFNSDASSYVIAVGTAEALKVVKASDVIEALLNNKEVRLKYVEIENDLSLPKTKIKQAVYFIYTTFSGTANFHATVFEKMADFSYAKFEDTSNFYSTSFLNGAFFSHAEFSEKADFFGARLSNGAEFDFAIFSDDGAVFTAAKFEGGASFKSIPFLDEVDFNAAVFSNHAFFLFSKFGIINFSAAIFSGKADFNTTRFSYQADFHATIFLDKADFNGTIFSDRVDFSNASFEKSSDFQNCRYKNQKDHIDFSGVSGFSKMQIEWLPEGKEGLINNPDNNHQHGLKSGLKGILRYDETFYTALIKNYQDLGWRNTAHDVYYTYQTEKRKKQPNSFYKFAELILLELPFGYGVKLWHFGITFSFFLIAPGLWYWSCLLRPAEKGSIWEFLGNESLALLLGVAHSLNQLTPAIEIDSFVYKLSKWSGYSLKTDRGCIIIPSTVQTVLGWYLLILFGILFGKLWVR